jgi:L,D-peptidoglycan transpeptidase YkuD (ErfK/YbiS/YcfS/YnhG family)
LPVHPIRRDDGWCDSSPDSNYNRPVKLPYGASAEHMWRADGLYDVVVVLGYNDVPRVRGRGSAIFLHIARGNFEPTEGCVALRARDLRRLVTRLRRHSEIIIQI